VPEHFASGGLRSRVRHRRGDRGVDALRDQLCVRITYAERGNRIGARRLIGRAQQRLETYAVTDGPTYGLDLSRIIGWIRDPEDALHDSFRLISHPP
jgi:hypothetical protein